MPQQLQHLQPRVSALLRTYSDLNAFIKANDPGLQEEVGKDETRALMSTVSPTLMVIDKAFGDRAAAIWLSQQLTVFNEYVGKREKMDSWQITSLAQRIVTKCSQLKASEVMLFLYKYSNGDFGPLYGTVDPQEFMVVLTQKFLPWRAAMVAEAEKEQARAERDSWLDRPGILKPHEVDALRRQLEEKWKQEEQETEQ